LTIAKYDYSIYNKLNEIFAINLKYHPLKFLALCIAYAKKPTRSGQRISEMLDTQHAYLFSVKGQQNKANE